MMDDNHSRRESATSSHHSISSAPSIHVTPARPRSNRQPSIRIRRFPSYNALPEQQATASRDYATGDEPAETGRRRSHSDPQRSFLREPDFHHATDGRRRGLTASIGHELLPEIREGATMNIPPPRTPSPGLTSSVPADSPERKGKLRKYRGRLFRRSSNGSVRAVPPKEAEEEYASGLVDVLDLVDPEISTLNTLTNVQNSLFVPNLGRFVNRRPTYSLTRRPENEEFKETDPEEEEYPEGQVPGTRPDMSRQHTRASITSTPDESHFAVLPHGVAIEGWSAEDRQELNDHVRHMLHSRRSRFKRSMKGFRQYVSHPLGFFITLYATLITLFGLIWVLFLIGWISVGSRKDYIINVVDNILVALFALMGDGLAPFRAVDTYHMCFIWYYHHLTQKVRKVRALPPLQNPNDLPTVLPEDLDRDVEAGRGMEKPGEEEFSVLTEEQHKRLIHHQEKFAKSHTFYKPHETSTHHAFPIHFLIAAVILLDMHSCLQIALGTCTWAISYHTRPFALTTVILCISITVNITAGIVIMMGDRRTRKKDVLELMHKQQLTAEAMRKLERRREKERRRNEELDLPLPPSLGTEHTEDINMTERRSSDKKKGSGIREVGEVGAPRVEKRNPIDEEVEPFPSA